MAKRQLSRWWKAIFPAILLVGVFSVIAGGYSKTGSDAPRSDILVIDLPSKPGGDTMPAVEFLHGAHTERVPADKRCSSCHLSKEGRYVFKYMRVEDGTTETDMDLYHENCTGCHEETAATGEPAGPVTGECRSCHKTDDPQASAWVPIAFDKSLHYRHTSSRTIQPQSPEDTANCSACHHDYDKTTQKTVYARGEEGSCRYCHRETRTEAASAIRTASHDACVNCHQDLVSQNQKGGPVECAGCHSPAGQEAIETVTPVPRMKRNQPEFALLASWITDATADAKLAAKQMNPVPFKHAVHEAANETCRSCHHETLKKCGDCHTETGLPDGGKVQLAQAMHKGDSTRSCIGCHNTEQKEKNCAGCHASMPVKPFVEENCSLCHRVDRSALGPWPMDRAARAEVAANAFRENPGRPAGLDDEKIPDKVVIDGLTDVYEGVHFPHRQIFRAIEQRIADNRMAGHFHDQQTTLCMGCHHHSPPSLQPPKCASCHGEAFRHAQDGRPGLVGAYHGQCISCHQEMGIKEPAATDCNKCHKPKAAG
jgi:predicted CXXCH cytochrome family protein